MHTTQGLGDGLEFEKRQPEQMNNIDLKIKTKQMQNSNSNDGTKVPTSAYADAPTSSQTIAKPNVSGSLPSVDEAGVMAVKISEMVEPKLTAQEQSLFIAGFCECVKWLSGNDR